jgi:hypothetical protein
MCQYVQNRNQTGGFMKVPETAFAFTIEEIDANKADLRLWHKFVRRREVELIFSLFPGIRFHLALELGAGGGSKA